MMKKKYCILDFLVHYVKNSYCLIGEMVTSSLFGWCRLWSHFHCKYTVLAGLAWSSVKSLDAWGKNVFSTVNFHLMGNLLMALGILKNLSICAGSNGTVKLTVGTTACLRGRRKERNSVTSL